MDLAAGRKDQLGSTGGPGADGPVTVSRRAALRLAGLGALGGSLLVACAQRSSGTRAEPGQVTVTDQRSEKVTLDGPVRRMVTIPMPAAAMVIAVDQGIDHLVGMHEASWVAIKDGIMGEMFPAAAKIAQASPPRTSRRTWRALPRWTRTSSSSGETKVRGSLARWRAQGWPWSDSATAPMPTW